MVIKSLFFLLLFCLTYIDMVQAETLDFEVAIELDTGSPSTNFTVKADLSTVNILEPYYHKGDETSEDEAGSTDYGGADFPYDDKPRKHYRPYMSWWEYASSLVESMYWQALYATTSIIGYTLTITPKENALHEFSHSWIPLVVTIVVSRLEMTQWNPDQPLFNQLEEQDENRLSRLAIIMVPGGNTESSSGAGRAMQGNGDQNEPLDFSATSTQFPRAPIHHHGNNDGGDQPPSQPAHFYNNACPACNNGPCKESLKLLQPQQWQWQQTINTVSSPSNEAQAVTVTYCQSSQQQSIGQAIAVIQPIPRATKNTSNQSNSNDESLLVTTHTCTHPGCDKKFALKWQLTQHQKQAHPTDDQLTHTCTHPGCDKKFVYPSQLTQHQKQAHPTDDQLTHTCTHPGCDKKFVYPSRLTKHQKQAHPTDDQLTHTCTHPGCDKKFALPGQLTTHQKQAHPTDDQLTHTCTHPGCDKKFALKWQLTQHQKQAHPTDDQLTHTCTHPGCDKKFALPGQLTKHQKQAHPTDDQLTHTCTHPGCDKKFALKWQLTQHQKQAHPTDDQLTHTCTHPGCDKKFALPGQLTTHQKQAHPTDDQLTHTCTHPGCDKKFALKWQLTQHQKQAHPTDDQLTHTCTPPGCDKKFVYPSQLTQHQKQAHPTDIEKE